MPVLRRDDWNVAELPGRSSADPLPVPLGEKSGVSMRIVEVPPGPRTPHRHPHSCEVIYVARGRGRVWEGDDINPVGPGDVIVVEQGVPHATVCTSTTVMQLICFFPHPHLPGNIEELDAPSRE